MSTQPESPSSSPAGVSWDPPVPGAYTRALRFGEWVSAPVTPLFESWLLTTMEERLHDLLWQRIGQRHRRPYHVVVNGWYFYSISWMSAGGFARNLPTMLAKAARSPRLVAGVIPQTVRHSIGASEQEWRESVLPRYQSAVARAERTVESLPVGQLPALVDELAELAGEYFMWIAALAGAGYKLEMNLARFFRRHVRGGLAGSHLPLLAGFEMPRDPDRHAVASLDWSDPPVRHGSAARSPEDHRRLIEARLAAEAAAERALARSPRRLGQFRRLLADAQHLVPLREEQVRDFTMAWPAMRRAVLRIGESLAGEGLIASADDVFFLTRAEALGALDGRPLGQDVDVGARRARRADQARLVPPLFIGQLDRLLRSIVKYSPRLLGAARSARAIASGVPASPGRATGRVRVIRGPNEFDQLQAGEVLVVPLTAPAWTPLFTLAAAVVTDVGTVAAHASIIAREYGIPAVVGCGDATTRLSNGMLVTVDGGTGNIEPA